MASRFVLSLNKPHSRLKMERINLADIESYIHSVVTASAKGHETCIAILSAFLEVQPDAYLSTIKSELDANRRLDGRSRCPSLKLAVSHSDRRPFPAPDGTRR